MKQKIYRIIDANLNRSREGLRVCEDVARFVLEDPSLTSDFKSLRHRITGCIKRYPAMFRKIVSTRDSDTDVGKGKQKLENKRADWRDVCLANMERVKESLRVLEEFSKLIDSKVADQFKRIRFKSYSVEKKLISRF